MLYRRVLRPLLFVLPAEAAHHLALGLLVLAARVPGGRAVLRWLAGSVDPVLAVEAMGLRFPAPIGLAAGFDKDGDAFDALTALGFGFVEVGTVTSAAQPGNPRPRLFRLPADRALLNRMGFNSRGAAHLARRLAGRAPGRDRGVVGVNLGKTKAVPPEDAAPDFIACARAVGAHADYVVVNVSSPNTPGLRDLQAVTALRPILAGVREELRTLRPADPPPLLVKVAPDLADEEIDAIVDLALELGLAGIVATNTTVSRARLRTDEERVRGLGAGGVSGPPLARRALEVLRRVRARAGARLTLVSVGGIETADDVWERLAAGASLVQLYTAFVYGGPALPRRLARELARRVRATGASTLEEALEAARRAAAS